MNAHIKRLAAWAAAVIVVVGGLTNAVHAAVKPQKILAIASVNDRAPEGRNGRNTINFFDVTDVAPGATDIFNNAPMFSVYIGFDYFQGFDATTGAPLGVDDEDPAALTVNPVNGTMYTLAFNQFADKGGLNAPAYGASRTTNDTMGDFDLFRINYQAILKDYLNPANNRVQGTIYAPEYATSTVAIETALEGDPRWDGTSDGRARFVPHPESFTLSPEDMFNPPTVWLPGAIEKIGEVGRAPTDHFGGSGPAFFNAQMEFVNPETFLRLDGTSANTPAGDHQIRVYKRVSKTPGMAVADLDGPDNVAGTLYGDPGGFVNDDLQGGFNRGTTESWESKIIGRLEMDGVDRSEVTDWAMVKKNGVMGVWVAESDGTNIGDDLSFFQIDFSTPVPTVTKKDMFASGGGPAPNFLNFAEDPSVNPATSDAEIDNLLVDSAGNLVVVESGFGDTPPAESRTYTMLVGNYDAPDSDGDGVREILPAGPAGTGFNDAAAWTVPKPLPVTGALDDDTATTDTRFVAYDKGTGYVYIVDADTGSVPGFNFAGEDIYVFDPASGSIVYHELSNVPLTKSTDPAILNKASLLLFTRGDVNEDGVVNGTDIDLVFDAINDPTLGGTVTVALGKEWYDLTGDGDLTTADGDEMIRGVLGTQYGDYNLDGMVDGADLTLWKGGFGTGSSWASGDANGDGAVNGTDLMVWQRFVGFNNMALVSGAVPEPAALSLCVAAFVAVGARRRRR